jgi:8-oxo-dGTP pyrophosphatase MutT (NUDIX family)
VVEPRLATTVLLVRDRAGLEVLMVERHEQAWFASALVFPGGLVDPDDSHDDWLAHTVAQTALPPPERALRIAGFRELYEETGVFLADAATPVTAEPEAPGERRFLEEVARLNARLNLDAMHPFAHWVTPEFAPKRYDTHFRLCGLDTELAAVSDGRETVSAEWLRPRDALELGRAGERKLLFPTRLNLELLSTSSSVEAAIDAAKRRTIVTVSPRLERRAEGDVLVVPPDAGYGPAEEVVGPPR